MLLQNNSCNVSFYSSTCFIPYSLNNTLLHRLYTYTYKNANTQTAHLGDLYTPVEQPLWVEIVLPLPDMFQ